MAMAATTQDSSPTTATTTTTMTPTHRLRVMRSMRKLTALLGETTVLESAKSELTPNDKSSFLPLLELLSFPPQRRALSTDARPALSIRLPESPAGDHISSDRDSLFSPLSPTSPVTQNSAATLRHRMAKLTRTLGETVPVELIISAPPPSSSSTTTTPVRRRRRASTLIVPESALERQEAFATQGLLAVATAVVPAARAASLIEIRTDGLERHRDTASSPSSPATATDATSPLGEVHVHPILGFSPDALISPREWLSSSSHSARSSPVSALSPTPGRKETSWTGEWADGSTETNMEDVVQGLRKLRSSKSMAILGIPS